MSRLRLAWAIICGESVMYRMKVYPWAGPKPSDGMDNNGWVRLASSSHRSFMYENHFYHPVVRSGHPEHSDDAMLPYLWVGEEDE